jgi:hypothetical protein
MESVNVNGTEPADLVGAQPNFSASSYANPGRPNWGIDHRLQSPAFLMEKYPIQVNLAGNRNSKPI